MKLAIVSFAAALSLATAASAMVEQHELNTYDGVARAVTTGDVGYGKSINATSPQADWNNGEARLVTVFANPEVITGTNELGADSR